MIKEIFFEKEARDKIREGVKKIVKAVGVTMGAAGKTVLIGNATYGNDGLYNFPTEITKDGFRVTKHFELSDLVENRGAMMVKEAAAKTVDQAGDATTCTCVLAGDLIENGMDLIDASANSQELKRGIDSAVELVVEELKNMSTKVAGDNDKIFQVASVSANNDAVIGRYIADAYAKIGDDGVINIEESGGLNTVIKLTDGFNWDKGWSSPYFINNKTKPICEFEDALVLLYDKKIIHHTQIEKALEVAISQRKPLVIVCEDLEGEGLAYLSINNKRGSIQVCVVKSAGIGDFRTDFMEDLALLTGASYVADIHGIDIKKVQLVHFGEAKKVIISKDETVVMGGSGDKESITEHLNELKMNLAEAETEDEKYPIEKRIARLTGSIALIQVGAATESELGEKLDRYDDAVRSTKAAIQEGVLAGAGTSFIRISQKLSKKEYITDFDKGQALVFNALLKPLKQIVLNAGLNPEIILKQVEQATNNEGYNLKTNKVEDLIEAGILDSTKALRCALINAASVSGAALTSECLIVCTS